MSIKQFFQWLSAGLGGAIATAIAWLTANGLWVVNGEGLLSRQDWPISSVTFCAIVGAVVGLALNGVAWLRRREQAGRVKHVSQLMGFQYQAEAARHDLSQYAGLSLLEKFDSAHNRMTGKAMGLPVEMIDWTYVERGNESNTQYRQTVVLFPLPEAITVFDLRPRTWGTRLLGLVGFEGVTFSQDDKVGDPAAARFDRAYFLTPGGIESQMSRFAQEPPDKAAGEAALRQYSEQVEEVRRLFGPELIRFFADRPGWRVECDGKHLAIWRPSKIVRAADRSHFLQETLTLRREVVNTAGRDSGDASPAPPPVVNFAVIQGPLVGAIAGALTGFMIGGTVGGIVTLAIFFSMELRDATIPFFFITVPIFFGGALGGLALGATIGRKMGRNWATRRLNPGGANR